MHIQHDDTIRLAYGKLEGRLRGLLPNLNQPERVEIGKALKSLNGGFEAYLRRANDDLTKPDIVFAFLVAAVEFQDHLPRFAAFAGGVPAEILSAANHLTASVALSVAVMEVKVEQIRNDARSRTAHHPDTVPRATADAISSAAAQREQDGIDSFLKSSKGLGGSEPGTVFVKMRAVLSIEKARRDVVNRLLLEHIEEGNQPSRTAANPSVAPPCSEPPTGGASSIDPFAEIEPPPHPADLAEQHLRCQKLLTALVAIADALGIVSEANITTREAAENLGEKTLGQATSLSRKTAKMSADMARVVSILGNAASAAPTVRASAVSYAKGCAAEIERLRRQLQDAHGSAEELAASMSTIHVLEEAEARYREIINKLHEQVRALEPNAELDELEPAIGPARKELHQATSATGRPGRARKL
ncbi:MAG: hypothetical protein P4L46_25545 [Fimbriimonas sp.]|nr:hypothetical protein [Fimbriimonas sp.]